MASNVFLAKRVDFLTLEHLSRRVSEVKDPERAKACKDALDTLSKQLGVDPKNKSDAYKYGTDASVTELVLAGSEQFGSSSHKRVADDDFQSSAKFLKYLDVVKKKGAFDGMAEDSKEFKETMEKVKRAYLDKFEPKKAQLSPEEAEKSAEAFKLQGNEKLGASDYQGAIALYDQAVEVSPNGPNTHIYLSNRAAAYTHLKDYEQAAADCSAAIALKPDFAKAHSRLAHAQLSMGMTEEAQQSAERALELDATNGVALATLDKIRSQQQPTTTSRGRSAGGRPGGMPSGMPAGFPGGGLPGGMDMASMMNNPMVAQMMQDPQMMAMAQQMASDPNAMANLMGMMGGGAGGGGGKGRRQ
jgi:small glutamine-rich tetratricopeptide repeat-containing protein alpha